MRRHCAAGTLVRGKLCLPPQAPCSCPLLVETLFHVPRDTRLSWIDQHALPVIFLIYIAHGATMSRGSLRPAVCIIHPRRCLNILLFWRLKGRRSAFLFVRVKRNARLPFDCDESEHPPRFEKELDSAGSAVSRSYQEKKIWYWR